MDAQVKAILSGIQAQCCPIEVILYGEKRSPSSMALKSLDFCVIVPNGCDKAALLRAVYLAVESSIPFNVLLYSCDEWKTLVGDFSSYAAAIAKKGTVLYGQEP